MFKKGEKKKEMNVNSKKTEMTYQNKIASESFAIILIVLGSTLPIHFNCECFNWYWVFCVWIAVFVPLGLVNFKVISESKNNFSIEQKKRASAKLGITMFWYWYLDLVYMTYFNKWDISFIVLGIFAVIIIFYNLTINFINKNIKNSFFDVTLIVDLVIGVLLTIVLILKIDNKDAQNVITSIVSAFYGGLFTLVGVAWTIKDLNMSRKKDENEKAIPLFSFNMLRNEPSFSTTVERVCFPNQLESEYSNEVYCLLENSNKNSFALKAIMHDKKTFSLDLNNVMLPSSKCILAFNFSNLSDDIILVVEDELGNDHSYKIEVLSLGTKSSVGKALHTVRGIKELDFKKE